MPLQPRDLLRAKRAKAARFQVEHIDETDEVHARMIEAVPTAAVRALPIALEVPCTVVRRDVMLARDIEDAIGLQTLQHFVGGVELLRLRELRDIARVQHEGRALWQRVHSRYRLLKR